MDGNRSVESGRDALTEATGGRNSPHEGPSFSWAEAEKWILQELKERNDPRAVFEYLVAFPSKHWEEECFDGYLGWIYENADMCIELAKRGIPDVADFTAMLLCNACDFMEEADFCFKEFNYSAKSAELKPKILSLFRDNIELFTIDEESSPYRMDLRVSSLSRIMLKCGEENIVERVVAQYLAAGALKKGYTQEDMRADDSRSYADSDYVQIVLEDMVIPGEVEKFAFTVTGNSNVEIDLRTQRLHKATPEEKARAHRQHLRRLVGANVELDGHALGAAQELQKQFGIKNPHHFPLEVLKEEYDKRDADVPYGVLIAVQYDHNDAFTKVTHEQRLREFSRQLSELGFHLRIIEVDTPRTLAKRMLELDAKYGEKNKISFAVLQAHGGEEDVQVGNKYGQVLNTKMLSGLRPQNLNRFFTENPKGIIDSCYGGAPGGFAEVAAERFGATVHGAADISYGIRKITVSGGKDNFEFDVALNKNPKTGEELSVNTYGPTGKI